MSADLADRLAGWAREVHGPGTAVLDVAPMPGNAGLSFGFAVDHDGRRARYVIRLAPPGVPERGPNDVLRQVPLLGALQRAGIPVAPVVWSSRDPAWFGSSAVISEFIRGRPLHTTRADVSAAVPADAVEAHVLAAVDVLADVHRVDWAAELPGWSPPVAPVDEVARWDALLRRADTREHADAAARVSRLLVERAPADAPVVLQHGDFQTNNVLFDAGRVTGVVDWELAGIGSPLLDLAWLVLFCRPECWGEDHRARMRVVADADALVGRYAERTRFAVDRMDWHLALACHRFASIIAYNVRLHRTGRRVDPAWDEYAGSRGALLARALELLDRG